jgi:hypothetical protein
VLLLVSGCKGKPQAARTHHDWNEELGAAEPSAAQSAAHAATPQDHPAIPVLKPDKLDEAEQAAADALAARVAAPPPNVAWGKTCQANRKCSKEPAAIPACPPGVIAEEWGQLEFDADKHLGQPVAVQGALALTPARPASTKKCATGECCHSLAMNVVLDGRPDAVGLPGQTCTGDDSALCCTLPAGQTVIANGKVEKAPAATGLKYQLSDATFCTPTPPAPDPDAGVAKHM